VLTEEDQCWPVCLPPDARGTAGRHRGRYPHEAPESPASPSIKPKAASHDKSADGADPVRPILKRQLRQPQASRPLRTTHQPYIGQATSAASPFPSTRTFTRRATPTNLRRPARMAVKTRQHPGLAGNLDHRFRRVIAAKRRDAQPGNLASVRTRTQSPLPSRMRTAAQQDLADLLGMSVSCRIGHYRLPAPRRGR
jgi:hypothetical protein